ITGHAVRAMYMYTGAADVAAFTGDSGYIRAMKTVWEDVVHRNMYITGGIGSAGSNEGFSQDYDLPNEQAYCETCASVGMVFWNQRMNLLTGDSKYVDVLEKSLYNGALDGLSLTGDRFFYGNPLASRGQHQRREWFGTACCPANIARLVASVGDYIYARNDQAVWVNLFIGSETRVPIGKQMVSLRQQTRYPWEGKVELSVDVDKPASFALYLRYPNWSGDQQGSIYQPLLSADTSAVLLLNGTAVTYTREHGYLKVDRKWKKGDRLSYSFPMEPQLVKAYPGIRQDEGRLAIQRGPLVYCVEGADNQNKAWNILLPPDTRLESDKMNILDEQVVVLKARLPVVQVSDNGTNVQTQPQEVTAIPYYTWANRGKNEMQVWLPTKITDVKINYTPNP
ncbi:MAG: hypothetical protein RL732_1652, partial [Bacteroidota bacterium]